MAWLEKWLWMVVFILALIGGLSCHFGAIECVTVDHEKLRDTLFEFFLIGGGFLFTVYSVLISASGGFVSRLREDGATTFVTVLRRLRHTIFACFAVALATVPFIVSEALASSGVGAVIYYVWAAAALATTAYFMYSLVLIGLVLAPVKETN